MMNIEKMAALHADPSDPQEKRLYIMFLNFLKVSNEKEFALLMEDKKMFRKFSLQFKRYLEKVRKEHWEYQLKKDRIKQMKEEKFDEQMMMWVLSLNFYNSINRPGCTPDHGTFSKRFFSSLPK